jgi:hypothetical protein
MLLSARTWVTVIRVAWLIPLAVALVGAVFAAATGLVLARRSEGVESEAAERLLRTNLAEAQRGIDKALEIDWWWPGLTPLPTDAWDAFNPALVRRLPAGVLNQTAHTISRLKDLNAWARLQNERELRQVEQLQEWIKEEWKARAPEQRASLIEEIEESRPKSEFGERERAALEEALTEVETTKALFPLKWRQRTGTKAILGSVGVLLAVLAAATVLFFVLRSPLNAGAVADAIHDQRPSSSLVSCDAVPNHDGAWSCAVAYGPKLSSCAEAKLPAPLLAASPPEIPEAAACPVDLLEHIRARRTEKEDCFFAHRTGVTELATSGGTKAAGLREVPARIRAERPSFADCVD